MGCISLAEPYQISDRSKHIDVKYQLVKDHVQKRAINLRFILTAEMVPYIMTKSLPRCQHD